MEGGTNGVQDLNGNSLPSSVSWSFTTAPLATCPCSIWSSTATPATVDNGDGNAVELGVKFTSDLDGFITGIRFYKSTADTGTHIGNLWTSDGTLLASAVFTNESASGWQQVSFSSPVAISANTIYVASYYAPQGHYSDDVGFFASAGVDNPPLHALANTVSPNGVYMYSSTSLFPSSTASASNYWVDVVYVSTRTGSRPTVVSMSPADGATSALDGTSVAATFNESMDASTINSNTFQLTVPQGGGGSVPVPATVSYNSSTMTAILVPSRPLAYSTTYTAVVEGGTAELRIRTATYYYRALAGRSRPRRSERVPVASGVLRRHRERWTAATATRWN